MSISDTIDESEEDIFDFFECLGLTFDTNVIFKKGKRRDDLIPLYELFVALKKSKKRGSSPVLMELASTQSKSVQDDVRAFIDSGCKSHIPASIENMVSDLTEVNVIIITGRDTVSTDLPFVPMTVPGGFLNFAGLVNILKEGTFVEISSTSSTSPLQKHNQLAAIQKLTDKVVFFFNGDDPDRLPYDRNILPDIIPVHYIKTSIRSYKLRCELHDVNIDRAIKERLLAEKDAENAELKKRLEELERNLQCSSYDVDNR
jgi:hypothetical protein